MKISCVILFILLSVLCVFGQKGTSKRTTKKPAAKISVKAPEKKLATCETMFETFTDKMTDASYIQSKGSFPIRNGNSGFNIKLVKKGNVRMIAFTVFENGREACVDKYPKIIFLFTDGSKMNVSGINEFNCNGFVPVGMNSDTELKEKVIETVRISTRKGYVQADFTPLQTKIFFAEVNCLFSLNN